MVKPLIRFDGYSTAGILPWGRDEGFHYVTISEWKRRHWWKRQAFEFYWWHCNPTRTTLYRYISRYLVQHCEATHDILSVLGAPTRPKQRWRDRFVGWHVKQDFKSYDLSHKGKELHTVGPMTKELADRIHQYPTHTRSINRSQRKREQHHPRPTMHLYDGTITEGIKPVELLAPFVNLRLLEEHIRRTRIQRPSDIVREINLSIEETSVARGLSHWEREQRDGGHEG